VTPEPDHPAEVARRHDDRAGVAGEQDDPGGVAGAHDDRRAAVVPRPVEVRAPATGAVLGSVAPVDLGAAAAAARVAQPLWALVPAGGRARYVRRAAVALLDELDALADLLAAETGWPRSHAIVAELLPAVRALRALADEAPAALAERRLSSRTARLARRRSALLQAPAGVIGLRGPSASPFYGPAVESAAALLAGNAVLVAAGAPLAVQRLRAVFLRAGVPGELLVPLPAGDPAAACDRVVELAPPTRRGTLLVLPSAPRATVVEAAVWAAFAGSGRHAAAAGRLVAVGTAADGLAAAIAAAATKLRIGDPRDEATDVGPLASCADLAAVEAAVAGADEVRGGGRVTPPGLSGAFYAPVVLRSEAAFAAPPPGPVLAVAEVADVPSGAALVAPDGVVSIWTRDREQGERIARSLPGAVVWVGRHEVPAPAVPARLACYLAPRRLETRAPRVPAAERLPASSDAVRARAALAEARHGRDSRRWPALRAGAAALWRAAARG
jgi:acyl-CoA reductase-like NAD-dependent aldehyde dehydrogenase